MQAFLITMTILFVGIGVIGVVWWLTRRAAQPDPASTGAPVSPAAPPDAHLPGRQTRAASPARAAAAPTAQEPDAATATQTRRPPANAPAAASATTPAPELLTTAPAPEPPAVAAEPEQSAVAPGPYGEGSARPLPDGSPPSPEFTVKGNGSSKLYHAPESPYHRRTKAEVWFRTAEDAEAAGFRHWNSRRRKK